MSPAIPTADQVKLLLYRSVRTKLESARESLKKIAPWTVEHLLFIGGLAGIAYGASMVYRPLGAILGGWFAVKVAMLIAGERR